MRFNLKRGFSLVELLVVIAVLVVIVSLIRPSLQTILHKAEVIECSSKLKRAYLAYEMYLEDYNSHFAFFLNSFHYPKPQFDSYYRPTNFWRTHVLPLYLGAEGAPDFHDPNFDNPNRTWGRKGGQMQAYLKNGALSCPTSENFKDREQTRFYSWETEKTGTFAINSYLNNRHINRRELAKPSKMFFMTDAASWGYPSDKGQWTSLCTQSPYYATYSLLHESSLDRSAYNIYHESRQLGYYMDGKANNMFIDGHLELMSSSDLVFGYDGSPHRHYSNNGMTTHNDVHEDGLGFGDRNDRTVESIEFWFGGR